MADKEAGRKSAKILYRPVGMAGSIIGGVLAGVIFKQVWKRVRPGEETDPPGSLDTDRSFKEILLATTVQGALFALVKTFVDRAGARLFQRWSGDWPGN